MATLAIRGHSTRGSEVIALLEMLGGYATIGNDGNDKHAYYLIDAAEDFANDLKKAMKL